MIWKDKIQDVYGMIAGLTVYNTARSTLPTNLALRVLNQTKDWLCMYKPGWRDLKKKYTQSLDSDRAITLPDDFGSCQYVYSDPGNTGKPQYFFFLEDNDISTRYEELVTTDDTTGEFTRKFVWPVGTPLSGDPYVVYSKVLEDYTIADVQASTKYSFFPLTIMLVVAKKLFQDLYGVPGKQDPNWVNRRVTEELKTLESYCFQNNVPLDMSIKDKNGNPVYIPKMSLRGQAPFYKRPSPYYPSTIFTGGTG